MEAAALALDNLIQLRLEHLHRQLESGTDLAEVYRTQGRIQELRKLLSYKSNPPTIDQGA